MAGNADGFVPAGFASLWSQLQGELGGGGSLALVEGGTHLLPIFFHIKVVGLSSA